MSERSIRERIERTKREVACFPDLTERVLLVSQEGLVLHAASGMLPASVAASLGEPLDGVFDAARILVLDRAQQAFERRAFADWQHDATALLTWRGEGAPRFVEAVAIGSFGGERARAFALRDVTSAWVDLSNLAARERRIRAVADLSLDVVIELDEEGRFVYVSPSCESVLGISPGELLGRRAREGIHPDDAGIVVTGEIDEQSEHEPYRFPPHRLRHRDATWIWVEAIGVFYRTAEGKRHMLGVVRDVSAQIDAEALRCKLSERVLRSQKLESLGAIAGGIAHHFNNLLTPIVGNVGLALLDLPDDSPIRERMAKIRTAAHRATALTRQLLAYAGHEVPSVDAVNISTVIENMALLLESATASSTRIVYDMQHDLPLIEVDATHVGQVVMNLVANASESLSTGGGQIDVRTGSIHADQAYLDGCAIGDGLEKGLYVYLEVSDPGPGIPEADRKRIFDPFFTTRFTGRGLGLAVVHDIVCGYRGALELMSEEGYGTRIRVLFPTAALTSQPARAAVSHASPDPATLRRGTLLVVDDDEEACAFMADVLERAGFRVIQAGAGAVAVGLFERHIHEIDAVVLDYTMPLVSGAEVFDSIRRLKPGVRVLVVSGYAQSIAAEVLKARGLQGFLQKPFEPARLVRAVDRVLDDRTDA